MVPIGGTAMVPARGPALARRATRSPGADLDVYPPMSTLLESLQIPVSRGFSPDHVPPDCDRRHRRQRRHARQRRGGGGRAAGPACPLPATGGAPVPPAREDFRRHHGHARQDDDLGADGLAAARLRPRPGLPRRRRDEEPRPRVPPRRGPRTSCSRATSTTRPSSTAGRSSSTTSRSTSSSATSSTTTRTSTRTSPSVDRSLPPGRARSCRRSGVVVDQRRRRAGPRGRGRGAAARVVRVSTDGPRRRTSPRATSPSLPERHGVHARRIGTPTGAPRLAASRARTTCANALGAIALARGLGLSASGDRRGASALRGRAPAARGQGRDRTAFSSWTTSRTIRPRSPGRSRPRALRWPGRRLWALFEPRSNTAGPQDLRGGLRRRPSPEPTALVDRAGLPRQAPDPRDRASTAKPSCAGSSSRASPPSPPTRSTRSPSTSAARRGPATS